MVLSAIKSNVPSWFVVHAGYQGEPQESVEMGQ